jgi:DNA polymerase III subunit delta
LGDAASVEIDDLVDAAFDGRAHQVVTDIRRLVAAGVDPAAIATGALRRADTLARIRAKMDSGASLDAALAGLRPPPFYKRREAVGRSARRFSAALLLDFARRIQDAVLLTREQPALAFAGVERALLAIAASVPVSGRSGLSKST